MAYSVINLKDLTELKSRRGSNQNNTLATILGLDYPTTDAYTIYEWNEQSTATADDNWVVAPTIGGLTVGRWFRRKFVELDPNVAQIVKNISATDINNWNAKQDTISAGEGLNKSGNTLFVDGSEVMMKSEADLTLAAKADKTTKIKINSVEQDLSQNREYTVGDVLTTSTYSNPSWITSLDVNKVTGISQVGKTGSYTDLNDKPTIPSGQVQVDWSQSLNTSVDYIKNKPTIPTQTSQLTNNSGFITSETDPTTPAYAKTLSSFNVIKSSTDPLYKVISYSPTSAEITAGLGYSPVNPNGTSGQYIAGDGSKVNFPAQINANWNSTSGASQILNKPVLFSGAYADLTGKPTIPTNINQLTNGSGYITANSADVLTNKTGNISQWTNNSGYLTTITSAQVTGSLGYTPYNGTTNSNGYITQAGARTAISLTTTGTSGSATYNNSTGVLNIPTYSAPSFVFTNNSGTRAVNTSYQPSLTRPTLVNYSMLNTIALTLIVLSGSSQIFLEISPDNSTWTTVNQAGYSDGVAVAIAITKSITTNVGTVVPAGWYFRLRSVVSGGGSNSIANFQEVNL